MERVERRTITRWRGSGKEVCRNLIASYRLARVREADYDSLQELKSFTRHGDTDGNLRAPVTRLSRRVVK